MAEVMEINADGFENEVVKSNLPVLVDFWATWCGPCKKFAPVIEKTAEKFAGKAKFVKIKADENVEIAQKYSVIGVPCTLIFVNGEVKERIVNAVPESVLEAAISKYV